MLDESNCHFRVVGHILSLYSIFDGKPLANNVDPDQSPHYVDPGKNGLNNFESIVDMARLNPSDAMVYTSGKQNVQCQVTKAFP